MFKLDLSPTFWATVRYQTPKADGRGMEVHTFDVQIPRFEEPQLAELYKSASEAPDSRPQSIDTRIARLMVKDWRGVSDPSGQAIPFSVGALDDLLRLDGMSTAILVAFQTSRPGAARGN